jgi:hypothetical protein
LPESISYENFCSFVKVRRRKTDNSSGSRSSQNSERSSLPNSEGHRNTTTLEPGRLRVIRQRLESKFYDEAPASDRIAAGVLADVKHLDESSAALPH